MIFKPFKPHVLSVAIVIAGASLLFSPASVRAQGACEMITAVTPAMTQLVQDDVNTINDFIVQETNFITADFDTAYRELALRMSEFDKNFRLAIANWWLGGDGFGDGLLKSLANMTQQRGVGRAAQTMVSLMQQDGAAALGHQTTLQHFEMQSHQQHVATAPSCQADTVGPALTRVAQMAPAAARALTGEESVRRGGGESGTISSASGIGDEMRSLWEEYVMYFCASAFNADTAGCASDAPMAGQHIDLPGQLWGEKRTLDVSQAGILLRVASLRTLVAPFSPEPLSESAVSTAAGQAQILQRRAIEARRRTVYNALGQLYGERMPGSAYRLLADVRTRAGVPLGLVGSDPSYREIMEALARDRQRDPAYVARLIDSPESLLQEQQFQRGVQLAQWNDIYRRWEELLVMFASEYASELDDQKPRSGSTTAPFDQDAPVSSGRCPPSTVTLPEYVGAQDPGGQTYTWESHEAIANAVCQGYPTADPDRLTMCDLRNMVEKLPGFAAENDPPEGMLYQLMTDLRNCRTGG